MMVFSKLVQNLLAPLPLFLILFILSHFLRPYKKRLANWLLYIGLGLALIFSNRYVAHLLMSGLEEKFPSQELESYPVSDVIVALGGSVVPYLEGRKNLEENNGSRLVPTYLLYKAGKAKKIIVSGGNPYLSEKGTKRTEAEDMTEFLTSLGVPKEDVILEAVSRNTEENSAEVSKILQSKGWKNPLLVTSAFHMKRAVFFFTKRGVPVIPVAVNHRASIDPRFWYLILLPSVHALDVSSLTLKEYLGMLWAWLKNG